MNNVGPRRTRAEIKGRLFRIPVTVHRDGRVFVDAELPEDLSGDSFGVVDLVDNVADDQRSSATTEVRFEVEMDFELLFATRVMAATLKPQTINQVCKRYQDLYRELHGIAPKYRATKSWIYIDGVNDGKPVRRREVEAEIARMRDEIEAKRAGK